MNKSAIANASAASYIFCHKFICVYIVFCPCSRPSASPSSTSPTTKADVQPASTTTTFFTTDHGPENSSFLWPPIKSTSANPSIFQFKSQQQSVSAIQLKPDEASLKANNNNTPLWATTLPAVHKQPVLSTISGGTAMQVPFGTPFVYHVTPVQSLQVQRPVITPIFTVLPKGAVPQVTPVLSSPTAPLVIGETTSPAAQHMAVENLETEPSTGQVHVSPLSTFPTTESILPMPSSSSDFEETPNLLKPWKQPPTLASIPPHEMTPAYSELKAFAEEFKTRRIKLGFTQGAVGQSLSDKGYSNFAQSTISRFEQMQLSPTNAAAIKQVLERWIEDAERPSSPHTVTEIPQFTNCRKRKKRAVFTTQTRTGLEEFFKHNPRPNRQAIETIAQELGLLPEEVRVWFCNKRQKQKQQAVYNRCQESVCTSTSSSNPPTPQPSLKRKTPSPATSFSIEELSKSSTSSTSSSPVHMTSPFSITPPLACQKVFSLLPPSPPSLIKAVASFLPTSTVAVTTA